MQLLSDDNAPQSEGTDGCGKSSPASKGETTAEIAQSIAQNMIVDSCGDSLPVCDDHNPAEEESLSLNWSSDSSIAVENMSSIKVSPIKPRQKRPVPRLLRIEHVLGNQNKNSSIQEPVKNVAVIPNAKRNNESNSDFVPNFASHPMEYAKYLTDKISGVLSDRTNSQTYYYNN